MSTGKNNDDGRTDHEPSARENENSDTSTCPACDAEVADDDLLDGECPECGATTSDLFEVAAGLKTPEEARA